MPRFTIAELAAVFDEGTTLMDILESHRWATAERARSRRKASRRRAQGRTVPPVPQTEPPLKVEPAPPQE